jgi:hypothetical protein
LDSFGPHSAVQRLHHHNQNMANHDEKWNVVASLKPEKYGKEKQATV